MLSLRALSRAALRPLCHPFAPLSRTISPFSRITFQISSPWPPSLIASHSHFSTTGLRKDEAHDTDQLLSEKLNYEMEVEQQSRDSSKVPESIQDYLSKSGFQIQDKPGSQFVSLTKQFEDETIKIEFSIDAINELSEEYDEEDPGLEDEDLDLPGSSSGSAGRRNNINQSNQGGKVSVAPEDSIAASDLAARGEEVTEEHETDQSEDAGPSIPVDLQITISKSAQSQAGAMQIHAYTDDGLIKIRHISHYPSAQVATASTTEAAKEAAILYTGPPFENLDSELCAILEQYIEERGVNVELAQFVPEYVDYKEQREYVQWLQNLKKFVDA